MAVGDQVACDDTILTLETGKVALDIPTPCAGTVLAVHVCAGDTLDEGAALITVQID